jgi:hypothetical protein
VSVWAAMVAFSTVTSTVLALSACMLASRRDRQLETATHPVTAGVGAGYRRDNVEGTGSASQSG